MLHLGQSDQSNMEVERRINILKSHYPTLTCCMLDDTEPPYKKESLLLCEPSV